MRRSIGRGPALIAAIGAALCSGGTASRADGPKAAEPARMAWAREVVRARAARGETAPDFGSGRAWLNVSRPLVRSRDLAGKVVVMDFWCYCCINCMHILPDLEYLERKYEGKAVAVVGVHSA